MCYPLPRLICAFSHVSLAMLIYKIENHFHDNNYNMQPNDLNISKFHLSETYADMRILTSMANLPGHRVLFAAISEDLATSITLDLKHVYAAAADALIAHVYGVKMLELTWAQWKDAVWLAKTYNIIGMTAQLLDCQPCGCSPTMLAKLAHETNNDGLGRYAAMKLNSDQSTTDHILVCNFDASVYKSLRKWWTDCGLSKYELLLMDDRYCNNLSKYDLFMAKAMFSKFIVSADVAKFTTKDFLALSTFNMVATDDVLTHFLDVIYGLMIKLDK